jgi:hypothetical protein
MVASLIMPKQPMPPRTTPAAAIRPSDGPRSPSAASIPGMGSGENASTMPNCLSCIAVTSASNASGAIGVGGDQYHPLIRAHPDLLPSPALGQNLNAMHDLYHWADVD